MKKIRSKPSLSSLCINARTSAAIATAPLYIRTKRSLSKLSISTFPFAHYLSRMKLIAVKRSSFFKPYEIDLTFI
jgi:hypothetical protein